MTTLGALHESLVAGRRIDVLASNFAQLAPANCSILDVGCGNGLLSATIACKRPDLSIRGIEVLTRRHTHIPVDVFDGSHFPFEDHSFDVVLFSDVLHHTGDPAALLREASRVTKSFLLIKDHYLKGIAASQRLRFMDWVGNARFGVALPYNYWREKQWVEAWQQLGLHVEQIITDLGLYPTPADWIFGAKLHFMARLRKQA